MKQRPYQLESTGDDQVDRNLRKIGEALDEIARTINAGVIQAPGNRQAGDYQITTESFVTYTGGGGHTFTLPKANSLGGRPSAVMVLNNGHGSTPNNTTGGTFDVGTGGIALRASGSDTINDVASIGLGQGEMTLVVGDGASAWRTQTPLLRGTVNPSFMTVRTIDPSVGSTIGHFARRMVAVFRATANIAAGRAGIADQLEYTCDAAGFLVASNWNGLRIVATETDLGGAVNYLLRVFRVGFANDLFYISGGATPECNIATAKLGVLGATPIVRQAAIASPAGGATIDVEARAAIDALRLVVQGFGFTL